MAAGATGGRGWDLVADPWLGQVLGRPVHALKTGPGLEAEDLARVLGGLPPGSMTWAKTPAEDLALAGRLQEAGFRLADAALTLERPAAPPVREHLPPGVRLAGPRDEEAVAALARAGFTRSRFHLDARVGRQAADRVKESWARNYFRGQRGELMAVAGGAGGLAGFLQVLERGEALVIDLVAVAPASRRQGLAAGMIELARRQLPGCALLRVGTQAANHEAARFYEGLGFCLSACHYVFHHHRPGGR